MAREAKSRAEGASASRSDIPALGGDGLVLPVSASGEAGEGGRPGERLLPRHFKGLVDTGGFEASEVSFALLLLLLLLLSLSYRWPTHRPKDRNDLWGQGCMVDPRYAKPQIKQNCAVPEPWPAETQVHAPEAEREHLGSAGAARGRGPHPQAISAAGTFLNSLPHGFQDCAQVVARIRRVKTVSVADPALQIPNAKYVLGPGQP